MRIACVWLFAAVACSKSSPEVATHSSALVFDPGGHDFGTIEVGSAATKRFTLRPTPNTDWEKDIVRSVTTDCAVMRPTAPGLPAEVSRMCPDGMGGVTYGADCAAGNIEVKEVVYAFDVQFAPVQQGSYTCRVLIEFRDNGVVALPVVGMGKKPQLALAVPQPEIKFGSIKTDVTSTPVEIKLKNAGALNHVVGPIVLVNPPGVTPFAVTGNPGTLTLLPDGELKLQVRCTPPGFGVEYRGKVQIGNQDPKLPKPYEVALTCTGLDTKIELAPTSIMFPTTRVGQAVDMTLSIRNSGNINDKLTSVVFDAASPALGFVAQPVNVTLLSASANTVTTTLRFAPIARMSPPADLGDLVLNFENESPQRIPITGEALLADPETDPPTADFGTVCIGQTASRTLDVFDMGEGGFAVKEIIFMSSTFTLKPNVALPAPVSGGRVDAVTLTATAAPMAETKTTRTAIIVTDAPTLAHQNVLVNLVVEGLPGGVAARPKRVHFEERQVGRATYRKHVTLSNCEAGPITVTSVSFDGPDREDFTLVDEFEEQDVATKGEITIDVQAVPSHGGVIEARLVVETSAGTAFVDLDGTGTVETLPLTPRDTYYACAASHIGSLWPVALALGLLARRRRRRV